MVMCIHLISFLQYLNAAFYRLRLAQKLTYLTHTPT